jgi:hypothetical protein
MPDKPEALGSFEPASPSYKGAAFFVKYQIKMCARISLGREGLFTKMNFCGLCLPDAICVRPDTKKLFLSHGTSPSLPRRRRKEEDELPYTLLGNFPYRSLKLLEKARKSP